MVTSAPWPPIEGVGYHISALAEEVTKRGSEVTIATRGRGVASRPSLTGTPEVVFLPFLPIYPFHIMAQATLARCWVRTVRGHYDIVHYHSPLVPLLSLNVPSVVTFHTPMRYDVPTGSLTNLVGWLSLAQLPFSLWSELRLFRHCRQVVAVSQAVARELAWYGKPAGLIEVIPNGVDIKVFRPGSKARRSYGLFVGRLEYRKGVKDLPDIVSRITQKSRGFRWDVVGQGRMGIWLADEIRHRGLERVVRIHGFVSRNLLAGLYRDASFLLLPSRYEGLPTVALEAMSSGTAVVGWDIPALRGIVRNGENGIVVPLGNVDMLTSAVASLVENPSEADRLGRNARASVENAFSWSRLADRWLELYRSLA